MQLTSPSHYQATVQMEETTKFAAANLGGKLIFACAVCGRKGESVGLAYCASGGSHHATAVLTNWT